MGRLVVVVLAVGLLAAVSACGNDSPSETSSPNPSSTTPGADGPILQGPASRYIPAVDEVPSFLLVDAAETFPVARDGYLVLGPFSDTVEGRRLLNSWGYESGYRAQFAPDGLLAGVMLGRYYATVEAYLFPTPGGAQQAFARYVDQGDDPAGVEPVRLGDDLGQERAAWRLKEGTVGESSVPAVYYRLVLREGNLVAVVTTFAAEPYASEQPAVDLARIVVERARGTRPAVEPTPFPTPSGASSGP